MDRYGMVLNQSFQNFISSSSIGPAKPIFNAIFFFIRYGEGVEKRPIESVDFFASLKENHI
jgi:hypothetical protein